MGRDTDDDRDVGPRAGAITPFLANVAVIVRIVDQAEIAEDRPLTEI
jgi:hypothetical protein